MNAIENSTVKAMLAEVGCMKLLLHVITKAMLPENAKEANEEIDALVKAVEMLAFRAGVGGLERESSEAVMNVSRKEAIRFLNGMRPQSKGN